MTEQCPRSVLVTVSFILLSHGSPVSSSEPTDELTTPGLRKKLTAFILTAMLAVTMSTPDFAGEGVNAVSSDAAASVGTLNTEAEEPVDPLYGWQVINGAKYYFQDSGQMTTGWKTINGKKYYFNKTGKMRIGWLKLSGKKYYFKTIGWKTNKGDKYRFSKYGVMQKGFKLINGNHYDFMKDGVMADLGIYKNWMISYTGKCYKIPKATKSKSASERRMANLIAKCSGKYSKKMGIKWKYVNENKYTHQWCSVTMDGKKAGPTA